MSIKIPDDIKDAVVGGIGGQFQTATELNPTKQDIDSKFKISVSMEHSAPNDEGQLVFKYAPLKNLVNQATKKLGDFTTEKLEFDVKHPVDIITQAAYDGAVNLILTDDKTHPKLVNSRFSWREGNNFKIPDHIGYKDSNIYEEKQLSLDSRLQQIYTTIPTLNLSNIESGGNLKCGSYSFYFKFSDVDNNETMICQESGIVQITIGDHSSPNTVRMGLEDENTDKKLRFELSNIQDGFDYVHVIFARNSAGQDQTPSTTYHKIVYDYPIVNKKCDIVITGFEDIRNISESDFYSKYADIDSAKTIAESNNKLLLGNIDSTERDYNKLQQIAWRIIPRVIEPTRKIGSLTYYYTNYSSLEDNKGGYYNPKNVYNSVGYWPEEIYRFGVVFIFSDNSTSHVFNIQGVDFSKLENLSGNQYIKAFYHKEESGQAYTCYENDPINSELLDTQDNIAFDDFNFFNTQYRTNSKGVIRFPRSWDILTFNNKCLNQKQLGISFDISNVGITEWKEDERVGNTDYIQYLKDQDIIGLFFVRQKRIPTIITQGLVVGLSDKDRGSIPIVKDQNEYYTQSFLGQYQILNERGTNIKVNPENITSQAMFCPDAELNDPIFNELFCSQEYTLEPIYQTLYSNYNNEFKLDYWLDISDRNESNQVILTNVPENRNTITDGTNYFSTTIGTESEPWRTADIEKVWKNTLPQVLSKSDTLIRGCWGPYVGMSESDLQFGQIVNIRKKKYKNKELAINNDFYNNFINSDDYKAICHWIDLKSIKNPKIDCYRGDCFTSFYTHRILRNFIDPELPTNHKIIDPSCWFHNYLVRTTAQIQVNTPINFKPQDNGFFINEKDYNPPYAHEICKAFEVPVDYEQKIWKDYLSSSKFNINIPTDNSVTGSPIISMVKSLYEKETTLHGLNSINRADINAVGLGQWITFPICSNNNICLRDEDFSQTTEQAKFNRRRSFWPHSPMDMFSPQADSNVINQCARISLPSKKYILQAKTPFIKQEFFTRIYISKFDNELIANKYKVILSNSYKDYDKQYGAITKLVSVQDNVLVVQDHGIGIIAVSDNPVASESLGEIQMLSKDIGSIWKDSIISTDTSVYGVDTVAKKIWEYSINDKKLSILSDAKVEKFLIDNIDLTEIERQEFVGHRNVKTNYNAFKGDVIFTYYNDIPYSDKDLTSRLYIQDVDPLSQIYWKEGKHWSLCYNVQSQMFTTFYDWCPVASENIDNVFFTFDREQANAIYEQNAGELPIWKHGQGGNYTDQDPIKPTNWYGKQHEFNFEFVVNKEQYVHKIFNNLKIVSNKVEPMKFEFEVVGEAYEWYEYKQILGWIWKHILDDPDYETDAQNTIKKWFKLVLENDLKTIRSFYQDFPYLFNKLGSYVIKKLPLLKVKEFGLPGVHYSERYRHNEYPGITNSKTSPVLPVNRQFNSDQDDLYKNTKDSFRENSSKTMLVHDNQVNEYRVRTEQLGNNIKKFGRLRGNMHYLEDLWDVEIRPITFKWVYLNGDDVELSKTTETRLRDKYIKIKIRYTGEDLALIYSVISFFDYSYA